MELEQSHRLDGILNPLLHFCSEELPLRRNLSTTYEPDTSRNPLVTGLPRKGAAGKVHSVATKIFHRKGQSETAKDCFLTSFFGFFRDALMGTILHCSEQ